MIDLDIIWHVTLNEANSFQHDGQLLRLVTNRDDIAFFHAIAGDVDPLAVYGDVAVVHELTCREDGWHELGAVDHGVEAALQQADQVFTGVALDALGLCIDAAELLFGQIAVIALQLLLGAQLDAEIAELGLATLAVLAGTVVTAIDGAFGAAPDVFAIRRVNFITWQRCVWSPSDLLLLGAPERGDEGRCPFPAERVNRGYPLAGATNTNCHAAQRAGRVACHLGGSGAGCAMPS